MAILRSQNKITDFFTILALTIYTHLNQPRHQTFERGVVPHMNVGLLPQDGTSKLKKIYIHPGDGPAIVDYNLSQHHLYRDYISFHKNR